MADPKTDGIVCGNGMDVNHIHICFAQSVSDIEKRMANVERIGPSVCRMSHSPDLSFFFRSLDIS